VTARIIIIMGQEISQIKNSSKPDHVVLSQTMEKIADVDPKNHQKAIAKSRSAYAHFSDYCLYPDRFNEKCVPPLKINNAPKPIEIANPSPSKDQDARFADFSLFPDKFDNSNMKKSRSGLPADIKSGPAASSLPTGFLSRYRNRSASATDQDIKADADRLERDNLLPDAARPRSLSNSKMYYFDFSMIPDKDPNFVIDGRKKENLLKIPEEKCGGSSVPCSSLPKNSMEDVAQKAKRVRKTSEQFGFFDYSMIPDKDPKCFKKKP